MKESSEAVLIERLQKGDPQGLTLAYDRYASVVYSLFFRITHDQSIAEDLVQELFIRIWSHARSFDPAKGTLAAWILSVARNMAIDHVRSADSKFSTRLRPIEHADRTHSQTRNNEAGLIFEQTQTIKDAFTALSVNQKRVLEMAYFEGFSQSEIARQLQEPLGTVKSWTRAALLHLRSAIKGGDAK